MNFATSLDPCPISQRVIGQHYIQVLGFAQPFSVSFLNEWRSNESNFLQKFRKNSSRFFMCKSLNSGRRYPGIILSVLFRERPRVFFDLYVIRNGENDSLPALLFQKLDWGHKLEYVRHIHSSVAKTGVLSLGFSWVTEGLPYMSRIASWLCTKYCVLFLCSRSR